MTSIPITQLQALSENCSQTQLPQLLVSQALSSGGETTSGEAFPENWLTEKCTSIKS